MKTYKLINGPLNLPVIYVSMAVLFVFGRDTLIANDVLGFAVSQFIAIGLLCVLGVLFLLSNRREIQTIATDRRVGIVIAAAIIYLLPLLLKLDLQLMYFSVLLCVIFGVFMSYVVSIKSAAKVFVITMCLLTLYSFVATYGLRLLTVRGMLPTGIITNASGATYYNYGLAFASTIAANLRNSALFREPGVFSFFLLAAIYLNYEYVEYKTKNLWYIITTTILAFGVLSTFSTAGVIELVLLLGFIMIDKRIYKFKLFWIAVAAGIVALVVFAIHVISEKGDMYWELNSMFIKLFYANDSFSARFASIFGNLKLLMNNILLGDTVYNVMYSLGNNTSSSLILFAMCGLFGGLLNVVMWVILIWRKSRNLFMNLWLIVTMFMTFNTQNLITNLFFWLFPTMAFCQFLCNHPEISLKTCLKSFKRRADS